MVDLRLLYPLGLCPPVLEQDFDLGLGQFQRLCQFEAAGAGDVLVALMGGRFEFQKKIFEQTWEVSCYLVLQFQPERLVRGEGCSLPALPSVLAAAAGDWRQKLEFKLRQQSHFPIEKYCFLNSNLNAAV